MDARAVAVEAVGWMGTALVLLSYGLLMAHRVTTSTPLYQWMNIFGAVGLTVNGAVNHAYPSMALNVIWLALALYGLRRARRPTRRGSAQG